MFKKTIVLFFILFICQNLASAQEDIALLRQMIFEKTNDLRVEKGLPKSLLLNSLIRLAQHHSDNMVKHTFFSHTDHEGLNPITRAKKMRINPWVKKENQYVVILKTLQRHLGLKTSQAVEIRVQRKLLVAAWCRAGKTVHPIIKTS